MIPLLQKLKIMQGHSAVDIGVNYRFLNWMTSWHIFRDFLFAGVGAGEYHVIYPFYKLIPETGYDSQVRFFYAENEYLQGAAELGLVGFGILAAAFISFAVKVLRNFGRAAGRTVFWVSLGFVCSSIAMLVHSFFDFPTHIPANMGLFAAMGGVLVGIASSGTVSQLEKEKNVSRGIMPLIVWFAAVAFIFIPFLCRQYFAEQNFSKANQEIVQIQKQNRIHTGKLNRSYELFQKAKRWGGEQSRIESGLGQVFALFSVLWREDAQEKSAWLEKSEFAYKQALKMNPTNAEPQYYLGWIYDQRNALGKAEIYFRRASELEPQNPFYRYALGLNLLKQKKIDQAKLVFRETLAINKNYLGPIRKSGIILEK